MNNPCKIVQDLLPLYVDDMLSEETRAFVRDHVTGCQECARHKQEMELLKSWKFQRRPLKTVAISPDEQKFISDLRKWRLRTSVAGMAAVALLFFIVWFIGN